MTKGRIDQTVANNLRGHIGKQESIHEFYVVVKVMALEGGEPVMDTDMADIAQDVADAANKIGWWGAQLERYGRDA